MPKSKPTKPRSPDPPGPPRHPVTVCPPGPDDDPGLRFQPHQFDVRLGTTATRQFLTPEVFRTIAKDVTIASAVASIMSVARKELVSQTPEPESDDDPGSGLI